MQGQQVGSWLHKRRTDAKQGTLSCVWIQQIEDALGVDALVPVIDFERTLAEVVHHRSTYGRLPVRSSDDPHMHRLGDWLSTQRQAYSGGTQAEARSKRLDSVLGPEWRPAFKNDMVRLITHALDAMDTSH